MFRRRFSRFRGGRQKPRLMKWNATAVQGANVTYAILQEIPLVIAADYAPSTTMSPSGVTVVRTVGMALWYPTEADADAVASPYNTEGTRVIATAGIAHVDTDEGIASGFSPGSSQNLIDERWLWLDTSGFEVMEAVAGAGAGYQVKPMYKFTWDIRQRVKLRDSGLSLFWILQNLSGPGGITYNISVTNRTLLQFH